MIVGRFFTWFYWISPKKLLEEVVWSSMLIHFGEKIIVQTPNEFYQSITSYLIQFECSPRFSRNWDYAERSSTASMMRSHETCRGYCDLGVDLNSSSSWDKLLRRLRNERRGRRRHCENGRRGWGGGLLYLKVDRAFAAFDDNAAECLDELSFNLSMKGSSKAKSIFFCTISFDTFCLFHVVAWREKSSS